MNSTFSSDEEVQERKKQFSTKQVRDPSSPGLSELGQKANPEASALNPEDQEKLYSDSIWYSHPETVLDAYNEQDPLNTGNTPTEDLETILSVLNPESPGKYFGGGPLVSENLPIEELQDYAKVEKTLTEIYRNTDSE